MNEFQGRWLQRGMIRIPVIEPEPPPRPRKKPADVIAAMLEDLDWTDEGLRAAHARYNAGSRDVVTVAGHREWYRRWKARARRKTAGNV